jgi:hypothetical protein
LVKTEEVFLSRSIAGYPPVAIQYINGKVETVGFRQMLGPLTKVTLPKARKAERD